jgi:cytochrome c
LTYIKGTAWLIRYVATSWTGNGGGWQGWHSHTKEMNMANNLNGKWQLGVGAGIFGVVLAGWAGVLFGADVDAGAAEALAKKSGCMTCHSIAKKKAAPSYKAIAEKYKGKGDAEATLYKHLTTNPKVKVDGKEEEHDALKTKNEAEVRNVVKWVLSR